MANTLTFANQTLTDANIFGGINYIADLNTGEEFSIGNTASASVTFVTDVQLPLYTKDSTNGTFTWTRDNVSRGRFFITEVTKASGMYEVTAYDAMILLDTNIDVLSLTFPLSVAAAVSAIASYINCTTYGTINNSTMEAADGSVYETTTCRELLGWAAEASGCSVKIDGADRICFMYYASSGITVPASGYKEYGLNVADYTCAAIDNVTICDSAGMTAASAGSGTNSLFIQGNPFLYEATDAEAAVILGCVDSFVYAPFTCEMFEENGLEIGVTATFGSTTSLVMHLESSEGGAVASAVGSDSRAEFNKDLDIIVNEVLTTATATGQYFWHTIADTGAGAGAHITQVPKEVFLDNPSAGGGNVLIDSDSIDIRNGEADIASFGSEGSFLRSTDGVELFRVAPSYNPSGAAYTEYERPDYVNPYTLEHTPIEPYDIQVGIGVEGGGTTELHFTAGESESKTKLIGSTTYTIAYDAQTNTFSISPSGALGFHFFRFMTYSASVDLGELTVGTRAGTAGNGSVVFGRELEAEYDTQAVFGKYNSNDSQHLLEVGNGSTNDNRSNAFAVYENGDIKAGKNVLDGNGRNLSNLAYRGYAYCNSIDGITINAINTWKELAIGEICARDYTFVRDELHDAIQCKKPGVYCISVQVPLNVATSGDLIGLAVYRNGQLLIGPSYARVGGNYDSAYISPTALSLSMDDYLTLYIRNNTAARGVVSDSARIMIWEI